MWDIIICRLLLIDLINLTVLVGQEIEDVEKCPFFYFICEGGLFKSSEALLYTLYCYVKGGALLLKY